MAGKEGMGAPGRYRVVRLLGHGAFGRAEHVVEVSTGAGYALKTSSITSQSLRASALREVSLLRRLVHPNVVTIHGEWEHHTNELCVLLELCDGSLQDMISAGKAEGRLYAEPYLLQLFAQICAALGYVHANGVMHRDIKAANILYTASPQRVGGGVVVKLADFGVSRPLGDLSVAHSMVGTMNCLSPEILNGEAYNKKSDVWSLGCVLYELATLTPAFGGVSQSMVSIFNGVAEGSYPPLPESFSPDFHALVASMLQVNPELRPDMASLASLPIVQQGASSSSSSSPHSSSALGSTPPLPSCFSDTLWTPPIKPDYAMPEDGEGWGTITDPMAITASTTTTSASSSSSSSIYMGGSGSGTTGSASSNPTLHTGAPLSKSEKYARMMAEARSAIPTTLGSSQTRDGGGGGP